MYKIVLENYIKFLKLKGEKKSFKEILDEGTFRKDFNILQDDNLQIENYPGIQPEFKVEFKKPKKILGEKKLGKRNQLENFTELVGNEKKLKVSNTGSTKAQSEVDDKEKNCCRDIKNLAIREMVNDIDGTREEMREQEIDFVNTIVSFFLIFQKQMKGLVTRVNKKFKQVGIENFFMLDNLF